MTASKDVENGMGGGCRTGLEIRARVNREVGRWEVTCNGLERPIEEAYGQGKYKRNRTSKRLDRPRMTLQREVRGLVGLLRCLFHSTESDPAGPVGPLEQHLGSRVCQVDIKLFISRICEGLVRKTRRMGVEMIVATSEVHGKGFS